MKVLRCMKRATWTGGRHCAGQVGGCNSDDLGFDTPLPNQVFHELENLLRRQTRAIGAILRHRLENVGDGG